MEFLAAGRIAAENLSDREIVIHPPEANGNAPGGVGQASTMRKSRLRKSVFLTSSRGVTFLLRTRVRGSQKGKPQMRDEASSVLDRFRQGDVDAFETLFRMHQRSVFGWVLRIVREPGAAEDVTIEAFWRMHRAHARFDSARGFEPWARRIATHAALDWLRRQKPESSMAPEMWESVPAPSAGDAAVAAEIRQKDRTGLWTLAGKVARRCSAGSGGRAAAQGSCRGTGNHGRGGEAAGFSRAAFAEKRFDRTGDHTMTKRQGSENQRTGIRRPTG